MGEHSGADTSDEDLTARWIRCKTKSEKLVACAEVVEAEEPGADRWDMIVSQRMGEMFRAAAEEYEHTELVTPSAKCVWKLARAMVKEE